MYSLKNMNLESMGGTLFSRRQEQIILLVPILVVLAAFFELALSIHFSQATEWTGRFVAKFIFLHHIHLYFSFILVLSVPEIRTWIATKRSIAPSIAWQSVILAVSTYALYVFAVPISKKIWPSNWLGIVVLIATYIVSFRHNFVQTLGLSLAYNRIYETSKPDQKSTLRKLETWERRSVRAMNAAVLLQLGLALVERITHSKFFQTGTILTSIGFIACLLAIGAAAQTPQSAQREKLIYSMRYLLVPLLPHSSIAFWGNLSIHGIEYLMITLKIRDQSRKPISLSREGLFLLICCIGFFSILRIIHDRIIPTIGNGNILGSEWFTAYIVPLTVVIAYLHYFIDGVLFRFSSAETRSMMGPLLLSKPRS